MNKQASGFLASLAKVHTGQLKQHLSEADWAEIDVNVLAMALARKSQNLLDGQPDHEGAVATQTLLQQAGANQAQGFAHVARELILKGAALLYLSRDEVGSEKETSAASAALGADDAAAHLPLAKWTAGIRITAPRCMVQLDIRQTIQTTHQKA